LLLFYSNHTKTHHLYLKNPQRWGKYCPTFTSFHQQEKKPAKVRKTWFNVCQILYFLFAILRMRLHWMSCKTNKLGNAWKWAADKPDRGDTYVKRLEKLSKTEEPFKRRKLGYPLKCSHLNRQCVCVYLCVCVGKESKVQKSVCASPTSPSVTSFLDVF